VSLDFSCCVFHLAEALSIRAKHKALLAPYTGLDPKTHLLKLRADLQPCGALARVDQDGNGRTGAEALFSATASAPVFSATLHRQARHNYVSSRVNRAGVASHSWCLHNYSADEIDCSYADRSQCAETAAGGLGQCELNPFQ
jgi:hypothetical protein